MAPCSLTGPMHMTFVVLWRLQVANVDSAAVKKQRVANNET